MSGLIRAFLNSDYNAIVEIHNRSYPDNPVTESDWCHDDGNVDPRSIRARWVYEEDGRVLGLAGYRQVGDTPRRGEYELYLLVHPANRGCGIGTKLYAWLEKAIELYNPIALQACAQKVVIDDGDFLRERGWSESDTGSDPNQVAFAKVLNVSLSETRARRAKCSR
ncbi:MAG: GNAT family N-acetyltransferase [bacterium]|nr:GNAT family N-acetyltransferase [bacterium]